MNENVLSWTSGANDFRTAGPPPNGTMSVLAVGDLYVISAPAQAGKHPIFRLIHKNPALDKAWVIELPVDGGAQQHIKKPIQLTLTELNTLFNGHDIEKITLAIPPILGMTDDEIRTKYANGDKNKRCPLVEHRDRRYAILVTLTGRYTTAEILEGDLTTAWVKEQALTTGRSRAKIYDILHRYWAGNFSKNALIPYYWRSGAKGKERQQKRKLGRPTTVALNSEDDTGYALSDLDKDKLRYGWQHFLSEGKSRAVAYLETMGVFYNERWEVHDGRQVPVLLPPEKRPTPAQFHRWGPDGDRRLTASRIQLGEIDWAKKYRGISGSAKDGLMAVGMQAVCDTTTNDAYLKSVTSRIKTVGAVNRLLITESRSELIFGVHCGFEAPSARTFLLAVAQGATSKVEFCARFGIDIKDEDWPAFATRNYLGDNGEYRNEASRQALTQFGADVDNIPSGQPQFNGVAESKHHVLHARLDHTLDGTTKGKPRRRGKRHPALDACANYYEYMREMIAEILYHNNKEPVPHLLTAEMRRSAVTPTRLAIFRWLIAKGYIVDFTPNIAVLRAHLYPSLPATLTASGVYLLREDRGDKEERIPNLRYMSDRLTELGLLEQSRRTGNKRIFVRGNPSDLRSVWLQTEQGLEELHNIHADPILYRQATIGDLLSIKDEDKREEMESRGQDEQARLEIITDRQKMLKNAQAEKKSEILAQSKPMSKADHYAEIGKNREAEISILAMASGQVPATPDLSAISSPHALDQDLDPAARADEDDSTFAAHKSVVNTLSSTMDPAHHALINYRKGRI